MAIVKFIPARKVQSSGGLHSSMVKCQKATVNSVTFTYEGKELDFLFFMNTRVRDYLAVEIAAKPAKEVFADKVESGAA